MNISAMWRKAALLCLAGAAPLGLHAQSAAVQTISFDAAWQQVKAGSQRLAAARSAVDSKLLQGEGIAHLGGPVVSLSGAAFAYNANLDVNLDPINQRIAQLSQMLPIPLQNLPIPASATQFPSHYTYNRHDTATNASVSAVWPLYAGGVSDASRGFVSAQAEEAQADAQRTEQELMTQLVQRYFGAQLATRAARLRVAAFENVQQHDAATEKMLAAGVISRVERLQAQVAFEDARRNALKAQDDAQLAGIALARTTNAASVLVPDTPLFVLTQPVEPLDYFTQAALQRHPGLAKVAAKKSQAENLLRGEEGLRKPKVFAFGQHQLTTGNPDWVAGVGVTWTLFDALDHDKLAAGSQRQVDQAEHSDAQARSDIALLVERNWRILEQARRQFVSQQPSTELAQKILQLRIAGLREGTSTTLDLIDAETNVAKVQTERAQAAYDYVMALANLLEACGLSEEFSTYRARADVQVE